MKLALRAPLLAVLLGAALTLPAPAAAHVGLVRADPADGSQLASSPAELRLAFDEEIAPQAVLKIFDAKGNATAVVPRVDGNVLSADLPSLADGGYVVYWRALDSEDGHWTSGSLSFGVGPGPVTASASRATSPGVSWVESLLRWLDFSFLAGMVGSFVIAVLVLPRARGVGLLLAASAARSRVLRVGFCCALLAFLAGCARFAREVAQLPVSGSRPGAAVDFVAQTTWGRMWVVREIVLLPVLAALLILLKRPPADARRTQWLWAVAGAGIILVGIAHALTSHAASLEPENAMAVAADAAHVLAAGAWLGSVAVLALAIWPAGKLGREDSRALAVACRGRFAECMALSVGVVLATGLYSAAREVASVDGFLTTTYGHVLIIKTGIVLAAGALGAANFLILRGLSRRHRAGERRVGGFRSVVVAEILAGVGIFLAASILASSVPARGPEFAAPRPARVITQSIPSGDLFVTVSMRPTRAGNNSVTVFAGSTRRPPPAPIETVSLDLRQGGTTKAIALAPVEQGRYVGLANVPSPGSWNLVVAVERGGKEIVLPASTWSLGPSDPARAVRYSARSVAPALDALAGLLLGLTLLGGLWLLAGRPGLGAPRPTSAAATGDRAP